MTFKEVEENPQSTVKLQCVRGYGKKYKKNELHRRCDIPDFIGKNWKIFFREDKL